MKTSSKKTTADQAAASLKLDGKNSYVECPTNPAYNFAGDFTVEAWLRPSSGGTIVARTGADPGTNDGWSLSLLESGAVQFGLWNQSRKHYAVGVTRAATPMFDDSWHHVAAVRQGGGLFLYIDGIPYDLEVSLNSTSVGVSNNLGLTIGATSLVGGQTDRGCFNGQIDEVRLWNIALAKWQIDQGIYHLRGKSNPALVGRWGFDDGTAKDGSTTANDGKLRGNAGFDAPGFYFVPEGQPFVLVQSRLIQDYDVDSAGVTSEVTALRTVLALREADGSPHAGRISIWADSPIEVMVKGSRCQLGPQSPTTFDTNALGQVSIGLPISNALRAPVLKIQADFMLEEERIVVPVDRQLHFRLSKLTGSDLRGGATPVLDPSQHTEQQADALASAVANVMSMAVQQDMQPAYPDITPSPTGRATVRCGDDPDAPERFNYLPVDIPCPACDEKSDVIKCAYMEKDSDIERTAVSFFMPVPYWEYDPRNLAFTPITEAQARALGQKVSAAAGSLGDLWDKFVSGVLNVAKVVVSIGQAVVEGVQVGISYLVDGVEQFFSKCITTLNDAVDFVIGIFKQAQIAIEKVIAAIKSLFDWTNIRLTHKVLSRYLQQLGQFSVDSVVALEASIHDYADSLRQRLDAQFRQWLAGPGQYRFSQAGSPANDASPVDVRSGYVLNAVADNPPQDALVGQNPITATRWDSILAQVQAQAGTDPAALQSQVEGPLALLFSDPQSFLRQSITVILEAVQSGLNTAITLIENVGCAILELLADGIRYVLDLMTTRIELPVITWLYEEVMCQGDGSKLTMLDLICLIAAVPTTVVYQIVRGAPPFTQATVDRFLTMPYSDYGFLSPPGSAPAARRAASADDEMWKAISYCLGFIYSGAVVVGYGAMFLVDAAESAKLPWKPLSIMVSASFVAQIAACPMLAGLHKDSSVALWEQVIWWTQWVPFTFDVATLVLNNLNITGQMATAWIQDGLSDVLTTGFGMWHISGFVVQGVLEGVAADGDPTTLGMSVLKTFQNVVSAAPELVKVLKLEPKTAVISPITDLAAMTFVFYVNTFRVVYSLSMHLLYDPK